MTQDKSPDSQQLLQTCRTFVQRSASILPSLNVKLLTAPFFSAAVRNVDVPSSKAFMDRAAARQAQSKELHGPSAWRQAAAREIFAHVCPANATKLAMLVRSLPDASPLPSDFQPQADAQPAEEGVAAGLGPSAVPLILLCKVLSNPVGNEASSAPTASPGDGSAAAAQVNDTANNLQQEYKWCRKYLKQLEAIQLNALLRFTLLGGPQPVQMALRLTPLQLPGPLRLQIVQDGISLLKAALAKSSPDAAPEVVDSAAAAQQLAKVMHLSRHGFLSTAETRHDDADISGLVDPLRSQCHSSFPCHFLTPIETRQREYRQKVCNAIVCPVCRAKWKA